MWKAFRQLAPILSIAIIIGVAFFVWANNLTGDVARLEAKVDSLETKVDSLDRDVVELRQDVNDGFERLESKIETSQEEIIKVIRGHEHDKESGRAVFYDVP